MLRSTAAGVLGCMSIVEESTEVFEAPVCGTGISHRRRWGIFLSKLKNARYHRGRMHSSRLTLIPRQRVADRSYWIKVGMTATAVGKAEIPSQPSNNRERVSRNNVNEVKVHFTSSWTDVQLGTKPIGGRETESGQFKCTTYREWYVSTALLRMSMPCRDSWERSKFLRARGCQSLGACFWICRTSY